MQTLTPPLDLIDKMASWTTQLRVVGDNDQLSDNEKRDLMQTIVQAAVDAVTKSFSEIGDAVILEVNAGGQRGVRGRGALTHVEDAMQHVQSWASNTTGANPGVVMTQLLDTIVPLQKAYSSIT